MKRRLFVAVFLVLFAFCPAKSKAFFDFGQGDWLSGQNSILMELLMTNLEELTNIAAILENMRIVAEAGNEGLAIARETYRNYQMIRRYSWDDLRRDAQRGMYRAFPELYKIEQEAIEYKRQYKNRNRFFSYYGRHDYQMAQTIDKVMSHTYKATIWPHVFPSAFDDMAKNPSPVDLNIWKRYMKSGKAAEVAVKKTSLYALSRKVEELVREAGQQNRIDLEAQATTAQMAVQQVNNSTEFLDLYKTSVALEEEAHETERSRRDAIERELAQHAESIFRPGGMTAE